jgi:hypothetical protein
VNDRYIVKEVGASESLKVLMDKNDYSHFGFFLYFLVYLSFIKLKNNPTIYLILFFKKV